GEAGPEELQRAVDDVSAAYAGRRPRHDTDAAAIAAAAARRAPATVADHPAPEESEAPPTASPELAAPWVPRPPVKPRLPDLILIDGGKGQLNAAVEELTRLGLQHIPVIGLAKEHEEIHLPGRKEPLRLGLDSPAVKMLQRVRDEAHRFANTFN